MIKLLKISLKKVSVGLLIIIVFVYVSFPQEVQATASVASSAVSSTTTTATSLSVTMPSGVVSGDLLIIAIQTTFATEITTPSGWSNFTNNAITDGFSGNRLEIFYKISDGGEGASVTVSYTSTDSSAAVALRITGFDSNTPLTGTAATNSGTTGHASMTSPSMTTGVDDALVIRTVGTRQATSIGNATDHTDVNESGSGTDFDDARIQLSTIVQASAGSTGTATFAASPDFNRSWVAITFAVAPGETSSIEQQSYRFRNDDGSETAATWRAAENINITETTLTNVRLRIQASTTGDVASFSPQLEYKLSTDNWWTKATTTGNEHVVPTYLGEGTFTSGSGALSVPNPSGLSDGDVLITCASSANQDITTPTDWTEDTVSSPQGVGTADVPTAVRSEIFYKVVSGTQSNVTVADSGGYTVAQIFGFRGVSTTTPIDISAGSVESASTTSMSFPDVTTTVPNTMIFQCAGLDDDEADTTNVSSESNANLTSLTEQEDQTVTTGTGGGIVVYTGIKTTAGAVGNTTATGDLSGRHSYHTVAPKPIIQKILIKTSSNITAGGEDTTALLSVPSGKSFTTGRMWDDENGVDSTDIASDRYTEWEWNLVATTTVSNGEVYQFRVTKAGTAFNNYEIIPEWIIGTPIVFPTASGVKAIINNGIKFIINNGKVIIQ